MAQAALKYDYEDFEEPADGDMSVVSHHSEERHIDLVHLARQTLGDVNLEREVLSLFVVQSQVYLLRLQAADTPAEWKRAAHTIKGSARGIGAWPLAEAAEAAEAIKGDNVLDVAHRDAANLLLQRVCAANACIRQYFDEQAD